MTRSRASSRSWWWAAREALSLFNQWLEEAMKRAVAGLEERNRVLSPLERERVAFPGGAGEGAGPGAERRRSLGGKAGPRWPGTPARPWDGDYWMTPMSAGAVPYSVWAPK